MPALRAHAAAVATHAVLGTASAAGSHAAGAGAAPAAPAAVDGGGGTTARHGADGGTDLDALGAAAGIDFKLAVSRGARNAATTSETGMDTLAVRLCEVGSRCYWEVGGK